MNREWHKWYSHRLGRDMELMLYGHGGEPVILFPTTKGRFSQNEDFGLVGAIGEKIARGRYLVICVDSVDGESWYNRGAHPADRVRRAYAYESYILHEVVPLARQRSSGGRLTIGGASFGAFHAVHMGLRNPTVFQRLLAMSGMYDTGMFLDGWHDQSVYFFDARQWMPNLSDRWRLDRLYEMDITLAAGEHDFCAGANKELSGLLWGKGIGNHLSIWNGGRHDWPLWRDQIAHYLGW